jgi:predicted O-methyltransferase YrrM
MTVSIADDFNPREEFESNMRKLKLFDHIEVYHGYSHTFVRDTLPESIDMMFIDGDHRYSRVSQDIEEWFPKVKKGGILCGHDCETNQWDEDHVEIEEGVDGIHHGVVKAVFERFPKANLEHSRIWWVKK